MSISAESKKAVVPLKIYTYPAEVLATKADAVAKIDDDIRELAYRMIFTMLAAPGVGLAAPQVGKSIRMIVVDAKTLTEMEDGNSGMEPFALINPEIIEIEGEEVEEEGCLSIPKIYADVARPQWLKVRYIDIAGNEQVMAAEGFFARCIAHEVDHLDGFLFWDRVNRLKKDWLKLKFKRSQARHAR